MSLQNIRISSVSYLNSRPFIEALKENQNNAGYRFELDFPSECARKLKDNEIDIGLVPVGILPQLANYHIVSNYCIGANDFVRSVVVASNQPINEIKHLLLDPQSKTSNFLAKLLCNEYWMINCSFEHYKDKITPNELNEGEAAVIIGDKVFLIENQFKYIYDLAHEWKCLTSLPFVFACWASTQKLSDEQEREFNSILEKGILNKQQTITKIAKEYPELKLDDYFNTNIQYDFDDEKRRSMNYFLSKIELLKP